MSKNGMPEKTIRNLKITLKYLRGQSSATKLGAASGINMQRAGEIIKRTIIKYTNWVATHPDSRQTLKEMKADPKEAISQLETALVNKITNKRAKKALGYEFGKDMPIVDQMDHLKDRPVVRWKDLSGVGKDTQESLEKAANALDEVRGSSGQLDGSKNEAEFKALSDKERESIGKPVITPRPEPKSITTVGIPILEPDFTPYIHLMADPKDITAVGIPILEPRRIIYGRPRPDPTGPTAVISQGLSNEESSASSSTSASFQLSDNVLNTLKAIGWGGAAMLGLRGLSYFLSPPLAAMSFILPPLLMTEAFADTPTIVADKEKTRMTLSDSEESMIFDISLSDLPIVASWAWGRGLGGFPAKLWSVGRATYTVSKSDNPVEETLHQIAVRSAARAGGKAAAIASVPYCSALGYATGPFVIVIAPVCVFGATTVGGAAAALGAEVGWRVGTKMLGGAVRRRAQLLAAFGHIFLGFNPTWPSITFDLSILGKSAHASTPGSVPPYDINVNSDGLPVMRQDSPLISPYSSALSLLGGVASSDGLEYPGEKPMHDIFGKSAASLDAHFSQKTKETNDSETSSDYLSARFTDSEFFNQSCSYSPVDYHFPSLYKSSENVKNISKDPKEQPVIGQYKHGHLSILNPTFSIPKLFPWDGQNSKVEGRNLFSNSFLNIGLLPKKEKISSVYGRHVEANTAGFYSSLASTGLVSTYLNSHPTARLGLLRTGHAKEIGGVAVTVGELKGIPRSIDQVFYNSHSIAMALKKSGHMPFSNTELKHVMWELARGIYAHDTYPFFSLHFNEKNATLYPVIHPAYRNTLVGETIGLLDYWMKGFLNGGVYSREFLMNWHHKQNMDETYLKKNLIDLKKMFQSEPDLAKKRYHSLREKMVLAGLENDSKSFSEDMDSVHKTKFMTSYRMIGELDSVQKSSKMLLMEPNFRVEYSVDLMPSYKKFLQKYRNKNQGKDPSDFKKLNDVYKEFSQQIHSLFSQLPFCKKYFQKLYVITTLCYYFATLKKMGRMPTLEKPTDHKRYSFPKVLPPIPVRYYHRYPAKVTFGELLKDLCKNDSSAAALETYLRSAIENNEIKTNGKLEPYIRRYLKRVVSERLPVEFKQQNKVFDESFIDDQVKSIMEQLFPSLVCSIGAEHKSNIDNLAKWVNGNFACNTRDSKPLSVSGKDAGFIQQLKEIKRWLPYLLSERIAAQKERAAEGRRDAEEKLGVRERAYAAKVRRDWLAQSEPMREHTKSHCGISDAEYTRQSNAIVRKATDGIARDYAKELVRVCGNINKELEEKCVEIRKGIEETTRNIDKSIARLNHVTSSLIEDENISQITIFDYYIHPTLEISDTAYYKKTGSIYKIHGGCGVSLSSIMPKHTSLARQVAKAYAAKTSTSADGAFMELKLPASSYAVFDIHSSEHFGITKPESHQYFTKGQQQGAAKDLSERKNASSSMRNLDYELALFSKTKNDLEKISKAKLLKKEHDNNGYLLVHHAVMAANPELLNVIHKADPLFIEMQSTKGETPLVLAVLHKQLNMVKQLLSLKVNVNHRLPNGLFALYLAIQMKNENIALALLESSSIDVNFVMDTGMTPLHLAVQMGMHSVANALIKKGANCLLPRKSDGYTAYHLAAELGEIDLIKTLLSGDQIKSINVLDESGKSALYHAASNGRLALVKFLKGKGGDCTVQDRINLWTPLMAAFQSGYLSVAEYLCNDATLDVVNVDGQSTSVMAFLLGYQEIAHQLIRRGESYEIKDASGCNYVDYIIQYGAYHQLISLLESTKKSVVEMLSSTSIVKHKSLEKAALGGHQLLFDYIRENFNEDEGRNSQVEGESKSEMKGTRLWENIKFIVKTNDIVSLREWFVRNRNKEKTVDQQSRLREHLQRDYLSNYYSSKTYSSGHYTSRSHSLNDYIAMDYAPSGHSSNISISRGYISIVDLMSLAAKSGADECLAYLLSSNKKMLAGNAKKPFHAAISSGRLTPIKIMLKYIPDINRRIDRKDNTPIHIATQLGLLKTVVFLLRCGASVLSKNNNADTAFHLAIKASDSEMLKVLLQGLGENEKLPKDLIFSAYRCEDKRCYQLLIKRQHHNEKLSSFDSSELLMFYIQEGDLDKAGEHLKRGYSPNAVSSKGISPLHEIIRQNKADFLDLFLDYKADLNVKEKGITAIDQLIKQRAIELIEVCYQHKLADLFKSIKPAADSKSDSKQSYFEDALKGDFDRYQRMKDELFQGVSRRNIGAVTSILKSHPLLKLLPISAGAQSSKERVKKSDIFDSIVLALASNCGQIIKLFAFEDERLSTINIRRLEPLVEIIFKNQAKPQHQIDYFKEMFPKTYDIVVNYYLEVIIQQGVNNGNTKQNKDLIFTRVNNMSSYRNMLGRSLMHIAVLSKDMDVISMLKNAMKANPLAIDSPDNQGITPLMFAAADKSLPMVKALLQYDADPNKFDYMRRNPLHHALFQKSMDIAAHLIPLTTDLNAVDRAGMTPLFLAAKMGAYSLVRMLGRLVADIDWVNEKGFTALHMAAFSGDAKTVRALLELGAKVDVVTTDSKETALHIASRRANVNVCDNLMQHGADPTKLNSLFETPIDIAVSTGKDSIIGLFKRIPEYYTPKQQKSLLFTASKADGPHFIRGIILPGLDVNAVDENYHRSALHYAARTNSGNAATVLIRQGILLDQVDRFGLTPLHIAAKNNSVSVLRLLGSQAIDFNQPVMSYTTNPVDSQKTALFMACEQGHMGAVLQLLQLGADFTICDYRGISPLQISVLKGNPGIARTLLMLGDESLSDAVLNKLSGVYSKQIRESHSFDNLSKLFLKMKESSPLELAIVNDEKVIIQLFSNYQPQWLLKNNDQGLSPIQLATKLDKLALIQILKKLSLQFSRSTSQSNAVLKKMSISQWRAKLPKLSVEKYFKRAPKNMPTVDDFIMVERAKKSFDAKFVVVNDPDLENDLGNSSIPSLDSLENNVSLIGFKRDSLSRIKFMKPQSFLVFEGFYKELQRVENQDLTSPAKLLLAQAVVYSASKQPDCHSLKAYVPLAVKILKQLGVRVYRSLLSTCVSTKTSATLDNLLRVMELLVDMGDDADLSRILQKHLPDFEKLHTVLQEKQRQCIDEKHPSRELDDVMKAFVTKTQYVRQPCSLERANLYKNHYLGVESFAEKIESMRSPQLIQQAKELGNKHSGSTKLTEIDYHLIAIIRELMRREFGIFLYKTQVLAVIALISEPENKHARGRIAQVLTAEGKSFIIATLATYLACLGRPVDIVTSSDYLAKRDCDDYQEFYASFGFKSSAISHKDFSSKQQQGNVFSNHILYGTNVDFEFSILFDRFYQMNIRDYQRNGKTQSRPFSVVIADEVDNFFLRPITSARISMESKKDVRWVYEPILNYIKGKNVEKITAKDLHCYLKAYKNGQYKIQADSLSEKELNTWISSAQRALFHLVEKSHYVIRDKFDPICGREVPTIIITDHGNTERLMDQSRWSNGVHEFVEAKHKLYPRNQNLTAASISHPSFYNEYKNIFGLTGTIGGEAECSEIEKTYGTELVFIPPHRPRLRESLPAKYFNDAKDHVKAIIDDIADMVKAKRPTLVLLSSIDNTERFSKMLKSRDIRHQMLNDMQQADENYIVQHAGMPGMVTVATSAAGRGTDIKPNPESIVAGGLHVIMTFFADNIRVEEQGLARAGRGVKGSSRLILSSQDGNIQQLVPDKKQREELAKDENVIDKLNALRSKAVVLKSIERQKQSKNEVIKFECFKQFSDSLSKGVTLINAIDEAGLQNRCRLAINGNQSLKVNHSDVKTLALLNYCSKLIKQHKQGKSVDWSAFISAYKEHYVGQVKYQWALFFESLMSDPCSDKYEQLVKQKYLQFVSNNSPVFHTDPQKDFVAQISTFILMAKSVENNSSVSAGAADNRWLADEKVQLSPNKQPLGVSLFSQRAGSKCEVKHKSKRPGRATGDSKQKMSQGDIPQIEGLLYQRVPGDDHCFYHAVALYLDGEDYVTLRHQVADYLDEKENSDLRSHFAGSKKSVDRQIQQIRHGRVWGGEIAATVLMKLLQRPIIIIRPNGKIQSSPGEAFEQQYEGKPIFLYYNGINHYDAFLLEEGYGNRGREIIQNLRALEGPQLNM